MIHLTPFAISGLLIFIPYFLAFIYIFTKGKTKLTKVYSIVMLVVSLWGLGAFLIGITTDQKLSLIIWYFTYPFVLFIPPTLLHSVFIFLNIQKRILLLVAYSQAIFFSLILLTGQMAIKPLLVSNSFYFFSGNIFYLLSFIFWELFVFYKVFILFEHYWKSPGHIKKQILTVLLAGPLGFGGGTMNFLPGIFGLNIYPYGNFLIAVYFIIITHGILQHQLFDISLIIRKGTVYSIVMTIITIFYLLTVFILEKYTQELFGYKSLLISGVASFSLGLIFIPLRNQIQKFVDRCFFKANIEQIALQNELLREEVIQTEKYKTLGTLATGIAHEVKNPLTTLKTFFEYLPARKDDPEFIASFNKIASQELNRIENLVKDLLDFAKPSMLKLEPTNINQTIKKTLDLLSNQIQKSNIVLKITLAPMPHSLNLDQNKIKQALLNIMLNAIEAMPQGGALTIETNIHHKNLQVSIRDTGYGISAAHLKSIFEPFFTQKQGGTGLGLAITQGIIEQHKGKIKVKSIEGQGTEFIIELPVDQPQQTVQHSKG